jgi:hypothetical protein
MSRKAQRAEMMRERTRAGNKRPKCPTIFLAPKYKQGDKNWDKGCVNCGEKPTVHPTGLCGPCCFGEADTAGGNW